MYCSLIQVIEFYTPDELAKLVDFQLRDEGTDDTTVSELCKTVLKYSVHTRKWEIYASHDIILNCKLW